MLYSKKNYLLMALSALFILVGFILMSGGQSEDPTAFSPEIFSSRRIVVRPSSASSASALWSMPSW